MTLERIPHRLTIPARLAATMAVAGDLSARDLSYGLATLWLAAQDAAYPETGYTLVGDNGLRQAMARSRRDRRDVEVGRVARLSAAQVTAAGIAEPVAMPSLMVKRFGSGGVFVHTSGIRAQGDAQQQWFADPGLVEAMRVVDGEPVVELPRALLQQARCRMSVPLMLRLLAWIERQPNADWIVERHPGKLTLLVPWQDLVEQLGLAAKSEPKMTMRKLLGPAMAEINQHTPYALTISERRTVYRAQPKTASRAVREGRLQGILVDIEYPLAQDAIAYPGPRQPGTPWKPKPKSAKPPKPAVAPPAVIDNVATLKPARFGGMRSVKIDTNAPDRIHSNSTPPGVTRFGMRQAPSRETTE